MKKYFHLFWSLVVLLAGVVVVFVSEAAFADDIGPLYQAVVGVGLFAAGVYTAAVAWDCESVLLPATMYNLVGCLSWFAGLLVFFNFNRYEEIIASAGNWPIYAAGGALIFMGVILLVHHLTLYEQRSRDQSSA